MINLSIGAFICIIGGSFIVGGAVGLILTACLSAGRDNDDEDI